VSILHHLRSLDRDQRHAFAACLLGWTLDAFDFFLILFVVKAVAAGFHTGLVSVTFAITLTLMFRPLGALVFGRLADRFGRRPILMANVLLFSFLELATAFAPSLGVFLVLRALFGFAMGGEWGIGSSLVMESIAPAARGAVSGILQEGYALGYLLAALAYGTLFEHIGWRGLVALGAAPALLALYVRARVKESPVWERRRAGVRSPGLLASCRRNGRLFVQVVLLMTAFNFFSHGTQDLYPTFLEVQHHFPPWLVGRILVVANLGAIAGGLFFGNLSQRLGRRRAIALAARGIVPAHLNELSPGEVRATFPGFAYQMGNLLACGNATLQAWLAVRFHQNFGAALALVAALAAITLSILALRGPEAREAVFAPGGGGLNPSKP
jgi:SHS family lactate transporter-like MFS transporter